MALLVVQKKYTHDVTVDGTIYKVKFVANFNTLNGEKTLSMEGPAKAVKKFYLKSGVKSGCVEDEHRVKTALDTRAWEVLDPTQRCHKSVLTYLKPFEEGDHLYKQEGTGFRRPETWSETSDDRYKYYDPKQLAYISVREDTTSLHQNEIQTLIRADITRQMVKEHHKLLVKLAQMNIEADFKAKSFAALFNLV